MSAMLRAAGAVGLFCLAASAVFADAPISGQVMFPEEVDSVSPTSAVALMGGTEPCYEEACGDETICDDCCPVWTVRAGVLILNRSRPFPGTLVRPLAGPGVTSNAAQYSFGWAALPDLSLIRRMQSGNSMEVRYFGAGVWNAGPINLGNPGNSQIGAFSNFGVNGLTTTYSTRVDSLELNWIHPMSDRISFLAGFRSLQVMDEIHHVAAFNAFTADYVWNENNYLYGCQVGVNLALWGI